MHLLRLLFLTFCSCFAMPFCSHAQQGCTDPLADNYDPGAITNDGTCDYPNTTYSPLFRGQLPSVLSECSGLTWVGEELWANNDNGNAAHLFTLDTLTGMIERTVVLAAASNIDWEDLAGNEDFLFIGDFGNNDGSRQDLRIFRVAKNNLQADTIFAVDTITFAFSDQTDFTPANFNTAFDCEAFFVLEDSLHLFSKDWIHQNTKHYILPAQPGNHIAQLRDSMDSQGLVTAVDIDSKGVIALLGYNSIQSFMWLLFDYPEGAIFQGNKRKIDLGTVIDLGQTEGLVFNQAGEGYLSSETLISFPAKLFRFYSNQWTDPLPTLVATAENSFPFVFPNPFADYIQIQGMTPSNATVRLYDAAGKKVAEKAMETASNYTWYLPALAPGFYWLSVEQAPRNWGQKMIRLP